MSVDHVPDTFTHINQHQFLSDMVAMAERDAETYQANMAELTGKNGLQHTPRNIKDSLRDGHSRWLVQGQVLRFITL